MNDFYDEMSISLEDKVDAGLDDLRIISSVEEHVDDSDNHNEDLDDGDNCTLNEEELAWALYLMFRDQEDVAMMNHHHRQDPADNERYDYGKESHEDTSVTTSLACSMSDCGNDDNDADVDIDEDSSSSSADTSFISELSDDW